jgi:hypothetical protein
MWALCAPGRTQRYVDPGSECTTRGLGRLSPTRSGRHVDNEVDPRPAQLFFAQLIIAETIEICGCVHKHKQARESCPSGHPGAGQRPIHGGERHRGGTARSCGSRGTGRSGGRRPTPDVLLIYYTGV